MVAISFLKSYFYPRGLVMVEGKIEKVISKEREIYYRVVLGNHIKDKMLLIR